MQDQNQIEQTDRMPPFWLSVAVASACLIAMFDLPYGYFQFLRLVVTGYAAYLAFAYFRTGPNAVGWAFAFIALLFNPVFVISMSKGVHALFDLLTAGIVLGELAILRRRSSAALSSKAVPGKEVTSPTPADDERTEFAKFLGGTLLTALGAIVLLGITLAVFLKWAEHKSPENHAEVSSNDSPSDEEYAHFNLPQLDRAPSSLQDAAQIEPAMATKPSLPSFDGYAVELSDVSAPLRLGADSPHWAFRTRIRKGYAGSANFAENGVVTVWGCGTGCSAGVFIDRVTGEVHELPLGGETHRYLALNSQAASRLLLGTWEEGYDAETNCVFEAYSWNGSEFGPVEGYPIRAAGFCPFDGSHGPLLR